VLYLVDRQFIASFGETTAYIAVIGGLLALIVLFLPDGLISLFSRGRRMALSRQLLVRLLPDRSGTTGRGGRL
jgi:branched-chain amino acid transport system permease protein